MSDKMKRAQYSKAPDTEDWWGDFDPSMPPPPLPSVKAAKRKGMSLASQAMMLLACAVFLVCVCAQIFRISLISQQNKQIQELREQIEELSSEQRLKILHDVEIIVRNYIEGRQNLVEHLTMLRRNADNSLDSLACLELIDERTHLDCFGSCTEDEHYFFHDRISFGAIMMTCR